MAVIKGPRTPQPSPCTKTPRIAIHGACAKATSVSPIACAARQPAQTMRLFKRSPRKPPVNCPANCVAVMKATTAPAAVSENASGPSVKCEMRCTISVETVSSASACPSEINQNARVRNASRAVWSRPGAVPAERLSLAADFGVRMPSTTSPY